MTAIVDYLKGIIVSIADMIEHTIGVEGGYSNHPDDTGGATMWGITEQVARRHGYKGHMRDLPRRTAVAIYTKEYAIDTGFAAIASVSPRIGMELFDSGVNLGPAAPAKWFQIGLNVLNDGGRLYADIPEDGNIGPKTLATFHAYLRNRGTDAETVMLKVLNVLQGARYIELARLRGANESFAFGWLRARVGL